MTWRAGRSTLEESVGERSPGELIMYLSPFDAISRRALAQLLGRPYRSVREVPVDHLPPLGATVTPLAERRRQQASLKMRGTRSG